MKIPQMKPWVGKEEYEAIASCFEKNWITEGPLTHEFQQKLLKLMDAKYGVFAPNGTLALYLGLRVLNIGPGDEVLVPDCTFIASATAVEMCGATPVFVDVNASNFQIDLSSAEKMISTRTKAIMPVHMYGTVCNIDTLLRFAKKHKLKIIEDAAQAIGVHWKKKHAGTQGDVGCFSFFADKTLTCAEGGFVVVKSKKLYERLLYLRNQGRINRGSFVHPQIGYNFRITDIHAAVGLAQFKKLPEIIERKRNILRLYKKYLTNKNITFFEPEKGADWIQFRIPILAKDAHRLMEFLKSKDIEPRTFFYPLHKQPCFKYLLKDKRYADTNFQNSNLAYNSGICLPTFPELKEEEIQYICRTIDAFYQQ